MISKQREYPDYSSKEYWENKYKDISTTFDFYDEYEIIKQSIEDLKLSKRCTILNIGIGNSEFCEKMYDEGYKKIYNIDFSRTVIHFMKERNKKLRSSMHFETMDAKEMSYENNKFDIVFDKGVFDCVLCGTNTNNINKFLKEVYRVIKPKGIYFMISNTGPEERIDFLLGCGLKYEIDCQKISTFEDECKNEDVKEDLKKTHYIYICKKDEEEEEEEEEESEDR